MNYLYEEVIHFMKCSVEKVGQFYIQVQRFTIIAFAPLPLYYLLTIPMDIDINHLQKLACVPLSPAQEQKLSKQLPDIIKFLGQLKDIKTSKPSKAAKDKLTLRTIKWIKDPQSASKLLQNVHHDISNNSIVIKSVLS